MSVEEIMTDVPVADDAIACLILTPAQADVLRGETTPGTALEPVCLADGETFVLPAAVRDDPAHATRRETLADLPVRVLGREAFAGPAV